MATGLKRKRPASGGGDGGSGGGSASVPEAVGLRKRSTSANANDNPKQGPEGRRRLQRGAKDKAYAERLAAGNDFRGTGDPAVAAAVDSAGTGNNANGGAVGEVGKGGCTRGEGASGNGSKSDSRSSSKPTTSAKKMDGGSGGRSSRRSRSSKSSRKRERSGGDGVERIISPKGWPFNDASVGAKRSSRSNSSVRKGDARQSSSSSRSGKKGSGDGQKVTPKNDVPGKDARAPGEDIQGGQLKDDLPVLTRRQQAVLKSTGCEIAPKGTVEDTKSGDDISRAPDETAGTIEREKGAVSVGGAKSEDNIVEGATENLCNASNSADDGEGRQPAPSSKKSKPTNGWACNLCTLLNSNRKKKCDACGTLRYLAVNADGTLALDEHRGSGSAGGMAVGSRTSPRRKGPPASAANDNAQIAGDGEVDSSLPIDVEQPHHQTQGEHTEESQQSQLSAMIDAPVFTRSRRKKGLSQMSSPTQQNADEGEEGAQGEQQQRSDQLTGSQQSQLSALIDAPVFTRSRRKQEPSQTSATQQNADEGDEDDQQTIESQSQQQSQSQPEEQPQTSALRQWVTDRWNKKREKRQRRKMTTSDAPEETTSVRVSPAVAGEIVVLPDAELASTAARLNPQLLTALVPASVLSRVMERPHLESSAPKQNEGGEQRCVGQADGEGSEIEESRGGDANEEAAATHCENAQSANDSNILAESTKEPGDGAIHHETTSMAPINHEPSTSTAKGSLASEQHGCEPETECTKGEEVDTEHATSEPEKTAIEVKDLSAPAEPAVKRADLDNHPSTDASEENDRELPISEYRDCGEPVGAVAAGVDDSRPSPKDGNAQAHPNGPNDDAGAEEQELETSGTSQGSLPSASAYVQMTQQMPDFDYFSQASFGTPRNAGLSQRSSNSERSTLRSEQKPSSFVGKKSPATPRDIRTAPQLSYRPPARIGGGAKPQNQSTVRGGDRSRSASASLDSCHAQEKAVVAQEEPKNNSTNDGSIGLGDSFGATSGNAGSTSLPMFRTAGKKSIIDVPEESINNAAKLLSGDSQPPNADPDMYSYFSTQFATKSDGAAIGFQMADSGKALAVSGEMMEEATKLLGGDGDLAQTSKVSKSVGALVGGFQVAGSGKALAVSGEMMKKATKLLGDGDGDSLKAFSTRGSQSNAVSDRPSAEGLSGEVPSPISNDASEKESRSSTTRLFSTFTTAGKSKPIAVSEEGLGKANALFGDDFVHQEGRESSIGAGTSRGQSFVGFATAGSNAKIAISDEGLAAADNLFGEKSGACKSDAAPKGVIGGQSFVEFATAGSNAKIAISDEGLAAAGSIFSETSGSRTPLVAPGGFNGGQSFVGFATAGSNAKIVVSEEGMGKANALFGDNKVPRESRESSIGSGSQGFSGFATAGSNAKIAISDEGLAAASNIFGDKSGADMSDAAPGEDSGQSLVGFATAGSNAKIAISDESLAAADSIFGEKNGASTSDLAPGGDQRGQRFVGFAMAGSNAKIAISEESLAAADNIFDGKSDACTSTAATGGDSGGQSFVGFATAGSNAKIAISDEGLAAADSLFGERSDSRTSGVAPGGDGGVQNFVGFASAGSSTRITVSEEGRARADSLFGSGEGDGYDTNEQKADAFDGFTTGGSNAKIAITEEARAKADVILDARGRHQDVSSAEKPAPQRDGRIADNPLRHAGQSFVGFTKGGSNSRIAVSEEGRARADQLLGSQESHDDANAGASRRVRFSLDPGNKPQEGRRISSGFSVAGSRRQLSISEDSLANASDLFDDRGEARRTANRVSLDGIGGDAVAGAPKNVGSYREAFVTPDARKRISGGEDSQTKGCPPTERSQPEPELDELTDGMDVSDSAQVVTDKKGTPASDEATLPSSPHAMNAHTPLHEMTNITHHAQSVMKSKRLFENASKEEDEKCPPTRDFATDSSNYSKISLGHFASKHQTTRSSTWDECIEQGVKDVTLRVTSTNATKLRFRTDDQSPLFFLGQRDVPKCSHVGKVDDVSEWLVGQGCDKELFAGKWIQNHYRWIVWKLAAMERRFPGQLGGHYLTYSHVLSQMKGRYEKELRGAKRPAVRKLLNKDVSASMPIILCVSQILRFKSKAPKSGDQPGKGAVEEVRLEMTDGWYAVCALPDPVLTKLVNQGRIQVGSKVMICNAQLVGSDDGVDPLDEGYFSDRRNCPLFLKISANNSRLAKWDVKLGFVHPKHTVHQGGSLLVKSLGDIFPDGGAVPVIDLVVCKRYPMMYLEKIGDGSNKDAVLSTNHLTEAEEAARQSEFDTGHQRASEKYAESARKECEEEVDEDAPSHWNEMMASNSPEEFYEKLGADEKKAIDDWSEKRQHLLQSMVSRSIEDSLKDHAAPDRTSIPYIRVLVKALCRSKQTEKSQKMTAELTVWRVSEEHLHLLKEGAVVRMKNLGVKSGRGGLLQLSANKDAKMEPLPTEPTQYQLIESGYVERCPNSLVRTTLMSRALDSNLLAREADLVACVVNIQQGCEHTSEAWLTDESGLVMKLTRNHSPQNNDPFHLGNAEASLPAVVAFCNIQVESFDASEQCARGVWSLSSCKAGGHLMRLRQEELESWCNSPSGLECCRSTLDRIHARIPVCAGAFNRHRVCIGFILGFDVRDTNASALDVFVDYGEERPLIARFPLHLLCDALQLSNTSDTDFDWSSVELGGLDDAMISLLGEYFRSNQVPLHFKLEMASTYGDESASVPAVAEVSLAPADALSRLHLETDHDVET